MMKRFALGLSFSFIALPLFAAAPVATLNASTGQVTSMPINPPVTTSAPAAPASSSPYVAPDAAPVPQVVNSQAMLASLTPQQRIERLENQVAYLNAASAQVDSLSAQVDALRGQVEDLTYQVKLLKQQVAANAAAPTSTSSQTNAASAQAEATSAASPAATSATPVVAAASAATPASTTPSPQEQAAYQAAYNLMLKKQYAPATTSFTSFLGTYPQSSLASNAHYWLGDLYLAQGQPDNASQQYRAVVNDPNASKRPDAMVKLATILLAYGDSAHAKQLYQNVISQYPNTDAATQAQAHLKNM